MMRMMKISILTGIAAGALLLFGAAPVRTQAAQVTYQVENEQAVITGCEGSGTLEIPERIDGYPVVRIKEYAFYKNEQVKRLVVGASVTEIENAAFEDSSLEAVRFADGTQKLTVGRSAFSGTAALEQVEFGSRPVTVERMVFAQSGLSSVEIPGNVTAAPVYSISGSEISGIHYMFYQCSNLKKAVIAMKDVPDGAFKECSKLNNVVFEDTVETVRDSAFYGCTAFKSLNFGTGITSLETNAFGNCTALKNLEIPKNLTVIPTIAFRGCTEISSIEVAEDNPAYSAQDGCLYNKAKTVLYMVPARCAGTLSLCKETEGIAAGAFSGCGEVTELVVPGTLRTISAGSLTGAQSIRKMDFLGGILSVTGNCFVNQKELASVYIAGACNVSQNAGLDIPEGYLFFDSEYAQWQEAPETQIALPKERRVPVTPEMRQYRSYMSGLKTILLTAEDEEILNRYKRMYDSLTEQQKMWAGHEDLLDAALNKVAAVKVETMILNLPAPDEVTDNRWETQIREARTAYRGLKNAGAVRADCRKKLAELFLIKRIFVKDMAVFSVEAGQTDTVHIEIFPSYADREGIVFDTQNLEIAEAGTSDNISALWIHGVCAGETALHISDTKSGCSAQLAIRVKLPAPTGLLAKVMKQTVTLSWLPVDGAVRYEIYRKESGKAAKLAGTSGAVMFVDSNLADGVNYTYWVIARAENRKNSVCDSEGSGTVSVWTEKKQEAAAPVKPSVPPEQKPVQKPTVKKPAAPTKVKAVNKKKKAVKLTWKKVKGVSGYQIYRKTGKKGTYKKIKIVKKGSTASYTNKSLKKKTYYYKIRSYKKQGKKIVYGKWSKTVRVAVRK